MNGNIRLFGKLRGSRGNALLVAYLAIVAFLGIGAAFMLLITNEARVVERQRLSTIAFHIAEAGIERGLCDLRQDFVNAAGTPSWSDGSINGYAIGPDTVNYYDIPYASTSFNGGSYLVELKNVIGSLDDIRVRSQGTISGVTHTIEVYVRMIDLSPWNNAIFAGAGASGTMVNGNVDIHGSVTILGSGLAAGDYAIELGGTAEIVGNNYQSMSAALRAKLPPLPTAVVNGETVETLNAVLRVKKGLVGLNGEASVGEVNAAGNLYKETVDAVYTNDGFGGNMGAAHVYSDNGSNQAYDLGEMVPFPSLTTPFGGYSTYPDYLKANALVLTSQLNNITPASSFSYTGPKGSISMDGNGNMNISGIVYIDGSNSFNIYPGGTGAVNYTGKGTIYVSGNVQVETNLVTNGNNSFPTSVLGIMTPNIITFNAPQIDVMGAFYAENSIRVQKQTEVAGTLVSNYVDMGTNVPSVYQVPDLRKNLPPGMIGSNARWYMVVAWIKA